MRLYCANCDRLIHDDGRGTAVTHGICKPCQGAKQISFYYLGREYLMTVTAIYHAADTLTLTDLDGRVFVYSGVSSIRVEPLL